ncbi:MAG: hypothetical protein WC356_02735 [Candidatus Micrarchaeia archaeon]|jgi:hypothetical protein
MTAWNKDLPAAGVAAKTIDDTIRDNNGALETAIDNEHDFTTGGTQTGIHAQGSARCFFQSTAPATRLDGVTAFTSADLGSVWIDSDDNKIYILTATAPTWTNISVEQFATFLAAARVFGSTLGVTGDFAVNTDKFNVAASTGDTLVAGTLGVTGIATLADGSKNATSAAPDADAELTNKKYVDDQIGAIVPQIKAYAVFNSDGAFLGSHPGVSSVTHTATGRWKVNLSPSMADVNYCIVVSGIGTVTATGAYATIDYAESVAVGSFGVRGVNGANADINLTSIHVVVVEY